MHEKQDHLKTIKDILSNRSEGERLRSRESVTVEFKETFGFKSLPDYARSMAAFSNNQGGYIIFGVRNSPRRAVGIKHETFDSVDTAKLSSSLNDIFDPAMNWEIGSVDFDNMYFGYIYTHRHSSRPVICRKSATKELRPGEIYYRYHGQTKVIAFPELRVILDEARESERRLWMKHVENIARIGPTNVAFLDMARGDITAFSQSPQLLVDQKLLHEMKKHFVFVEEGHFSEREGAPTLQLKGTIVPAETVVSPTLEPEKNYPYILSDLASVAGISTHEAQALIWRFKMKEDSRMLPR
jgi:hypothetical protein